MQLIVETACVILILPVHRLLQRELEGCSRNKDTFSIAQLSIKVIHDRLLVKVEGFKKFKGHRCMDLH